MASGRVSARNVVFGRRRHCRERTSDAEQVDYLLLGAACWHQPQPTRNVRTAAVTCDDTRTLKFTLIVQRMPMSVRQGSQSYSDATCDSNSSADAMNVVSGHGGRSCFWGPSEMHNRDLVLALSDDIVVRQRLGNHAPWPAMQSMPRSDFSPQFRSPATTSMGTTPRRLQERHVLGERAGRRTQGLPRMLHGPSGGPARQPRTTSARSRSAAALRRPARHTV